MAWSLLLLLVVATSAVRDPRLLVESEDLSPEEEGFEVALAKLSKCYKYSTTLLDCDIDVEVKFTGRLEAKLCVTPNSCGAVVSYLVSRADPCDCPPSKKGIQGDTLFIRDIQGSCVGDRLSTIPDVEVPDSLEANIDFAEKTITVPKSQLDFCPDEGCVFTSC